MIFEGKIACSANQLEQLMNVEITYQHNKMEETDASDQE